MLINIIYLAIIIPIVYLITILIFDILLRGFTPFMPSRPWVVEQLMSDLHIRQAKPKFLAFGSGRSGFFHALEKKYPEASLIGIQINLFPYLVAKIQLFLRSTKIKARRQEIHHVDVSDVDFIYCHLYPNNMEGLGSKLKFECKAGTQIISTGFNIPFLDPTKIIDLPDRKGRLDWLSKNQKLFQRKSKKFKKEKKAYFYEI